MIIKNFSLKELQPTDTLRESCVEYMQGLSLLELESIGMPQVWETPIGLLISDGNQRSAVKTRKGQLFTAVDFVRVNQQKLVYGVDIEGLMKVAEELRKRGIYSPYDLWSV